jgi:hypothetical protein
MNIFRVVSDIDITRQTLRIYKEVSNCNHCLFYLTRLPKLSLLKSSTPNVVIRQLDIVTI